MGLPPEVTEPDRLLSYAAIFISTSFASDRPFHGTSRRRECGGRYSLHVGYRRFGSSVTPVFRFYFRQTFANTSHDP